MNSSFTLSDVGAFSPLDYSQVSFLRTPLTGAARNSRGAEQWKIFVEPNVLGRRVDPVTRRVSPAVTSLPLQPHSFALTIEPVTPNLLAREERERERSKQEEAERHKYETSKREGLKRPHRDGADEAENAAVELNGARAEKRLKVLHPSAPEKQEELTVADGTALDEEKGKPDTALVRLSSGRVVRVPIEILRQHQEQLKARREQQQQQQQVLRFTNGAPRTSLQNADQALSRVLARISPAATMPAGQQVVRTIPPAIIRQIGPQVTLGAHQAATSSRGTTIVTNSIRLSQRPSLQQQRVVRIRAYPGPPEPGALGTPAHVGGNIPHGMAPTVLSTANGAAKLSERLNLIEPVVQMQLPQQQHRVNTQSGKQPVRVRCYPSAASTAVRTVIPVTSTANPSHQRLSVALNSVTGQRIQAVVPAAGVQKSVIAPVERVIVLGPKPGAAAAPVIQQQQNGQLAQHHRVQLAPVFARQVSSIKQGAQKVQQQATVLIKGSSGPHPAAAGTSGTAAPRTSVKLVAFAQQPGGGGGRGGGSNYNEHVALGATGATTTSRSTAVAMAAHSALSQTSSERTAQTLTPQGKVVGSGSRQ